MKSAILVTALMLAGCATVATTNTKDAKLVGTRAPLLGDGLQESVYFTHLDNRELRNIFDQYPATISATSGTHNVTAICEWRASASSVPVAKHVRRFRMDIEAGKTYQFKSSFEGAGACQLSFEEVVVGKTDVTTAK